MAERDVAKACKARWDKLGLLWRRVEWIGRHSAPDFFVAGWLGGHADFPNDYSSCWVETKAHGDKPNILQQREHERMRAAGQIVLVIDSEEMLDRYFPLG